MNRKQDYSRFVSFMSGAAQGTPQRKEIDEHVIEIYFRMLEDLDLETVERRVVEAVRRKGWFPMISDIRGEGTAEQEISAQAFRAYRLIEHVMREFYFPGFGASSMDVIEFKLENWGESRLIPLVRRWGQEIVENKNPSATRAQFIKSFEYEHRPGVARTLPKNKSPKMLKDILQINNTGQNK